jgi:type II restriction enzyme
MDLNLNRSVAEGYTSRSQAARRLTEDWAARNLFCLACDSDSMTPERHNVPVTDYRCPERGIAYQLKSVSGSFGPTVSNSAYAPKLAAILSDSAPHYAFLQYSVATWLVTDLFVLPGHLLSPTVVQERKPLSAMARRSGWVGSNILLGRLPMDARVQVVTAGIARDPADVRGDWARYRFLQTDHRARGAWGASTLFCVRTLQAETKANEFTLQDFYARFTTELASRYPNNNNVHAKIRQQLQVLRDGGILEFLGSGRYRVIS